MAYKIQIGAATYSGSLIHTSGNFSAGSDDISATDMLAEDDVDVGGALTLTQGGFTFKDANANAQALVIGTNQIAIGNSAGNLNNGSQLEIKDNSGNVLLEVGCTPDNSKISGVAAGEGFIKISTAAATQMEVDGENGNVSGSNDLSVGGALTIGGNVVIQGDLDTHTDGADTITLSVTNFTSSDENIEFAETDGNGLFFGANGVAGKLLLAESQSSISSSVNLSASAWYGNGAQLTGITATSLALGVSALSSDSTASLGFNSVTMGSGQNFSVTLPATTGDAASATDGSQVTIKRADSNVNSTLTVTRHADDAGSSVTIDGASSVILQGESAIKCILSGSEWLIF